MALDIEVEAARISEVDPDAGLMRVCFAAPPEDAGERRPAQIALLIDRSSSMAGAPLTFAALAAEALLHRLDERDRLTLVAFDGRAKVLADAEPVSSAFREALCARLRALVPGAGTNIGAALEQGAQTLSRVLLRGASPRVLLLTDGEPSTGIMDPFQLTALCTRAHEAGISVSCVGLGRHYDASLLSRMSEAGCGNFHDVPTPDHIASVLMREVDGVSRAAASEVSLYVSPSPGIATVELLHRFPTQHKDGSLRVELGEVCAGARRSLLLLVRGKTDDELGSLRVAYQDAHGGSQLLAPRVVMQGDGGAAGREAIASEWLGLRLADALDKAWGLAVLDQTALAVRALDQALEARGRLRAAGYVCAAIREAIERAEAARDLIPRAAERRAELEAAHRADRAFTHQTLVRGTRGDD